MPFYESDGGVALSVRGALKSERVLSHRLHDPHPGLGVHGAAQFQELRLQSLDQPGLDRDFKGYSA